MPPASLSRSGPAMSCGAWSPARADEREAQSHGPRYEQPRSRRKGSTMSQFGMQMPGGRMKREASMNVYTGLLFVAVAALATASGFMWIAAKKVGVSDNPFTIQKAGSVKLAPAKK